MNDSLERAADWIVESQRIVAFSGAGVSAESGIATFRDPGGIWERFDPAEVGTPAGILSLLRREPARLTGFLHEAMDALFRAEPNAGHVALAEFERMNKLAGVITQNVDNLHQEAGSGRVVELHGNVYRLRCTDCGGARQMSRGEFIPRFQEVFSGEPNGAAILSRLPRCPVCDGLVRMDVVLFGEAVHSLDAAYRMAEDADLMLVLGTSGTVHPAADLPASCHRRGGRIVVINPHENNFERLGGVSVREKSGVALAELLRRVTARLRN